MKKVKKGRYVAIEDSALSWSELQQNVVRKKIFFQCGWLISDSSAVVRMYGIGAAGRLKPGCYVVVEAYCFWNCQTYALRLSYLQLKYLLLPQHPELFLPGNKLKLLKKLCELLYFEYQVKIYPPLPEDFFEWSQEQRDFHKENHPDKYVPVIRTVQHLEELTMPRFYPQRVIDIMEEYNNRDSFAMRLKDIEAEEAAHPSRKRHHHSPRCDEVSEVSEGGGEDGEGGPESGDTDGELPRIEDPGGETKVVGRPQTPNLGDKSPARPSCDAKCQWPAPSPSLVPILLPTTPTQTCCAQSPLLLPLPQSLRILLIWMTFKSIYLLPVPGPGRFGRCHGG